jgi:hypothetical protein
MTWLPFRFLVAKHPIVAATIWPALPILIFIGCTIATHRLVDRTPIRHVALRVNGLVSIDQLLVA